MAVLHFVGFEPNTASDWQSSTGTVQVATANVHSGARSLRINPTAGAGRVVLAGFAATGKIANLSQNDLYCGVMFYCATLPSGTVRILTVSNGTKLAYGFHLASDGTLSLDYFNGSDVKTNIANFGVISTGQYYLLELKGTTIQTGGSTTVEGKVNGAVVGTGTSLTVSSAPSAAIAVSLGDPTVSSTHDFYFDDYWADSSTYLGEQTVVALIPDGAGDNSTGWAGGTGSTFAEVDDPTGEDSDTTYIKSTASGDDMSFTVSNTSGLGNVIRATRVHAVVRDEGGASSIQAYTRYNGSISSTTTTDPGASSATLSKIDTTAPDGSGAWDSSKVDAAQVGVKNNAAVAIRVTAVWLMVLQDAAAPNPPPGLGTVIPTFFVEEPLAPRGLVPGIALRSWLWNNVRYIGQDIMQAGPGQVPDFQLQMALPPPGRAPHRANRVWLHNNVRYIGQDQVLGGPGQVPDLQLQMALPPKGRIPNITLRTWLFNDVWRTVTNQMYGDLGQVPDWMQWQALPPRGRAPVVTLRTWTQDLVKFLQAAQIIYGDVGQVPDYVWQMALPPRGKERSVDLRTWLQRTRLDGQDTVRGAPGQVPTYDWQLPPRGAPRGIDLRTWLQRTSLAGYDDMYGAPGQAPTYEWQLAPRGRPYPVELRTLLTSNASRILILTFVPPVDYGGGRRGSAVAALAEAGSAITQALVEGSAIAVTPSRGSAARANLGAGSATRSILRRGSARRRPPGDG